MNQRTPIRQQVDGVNGPLRSRYDPTRAAGAIGDISSDQSKTNQPFGFACERGQGEKQSI
jgi:hypothetical protein